jgi:hypothetical protein
MLKIEDIWVTQEEYNDFSPYPIEDSDLFLKIANRSQMMINNSTFSRIMIRKITSFSEHIQNLIKQALMSQIEFFAVNGGLKTISKGKVNNVSLNKFSYGYEGTGNTQTAASVDNAKICEASYKLLIQTGLLYAGMSG